MFYTQFFCFSNDKKIQNKLFSILLISFYKDRIYAFCIFDDCIHVLACDKEVEIKTNSVMSTWKKNKGFW